MVNSEENMTNTKDAKTRVTIGDGRTITGLKCGDWTGYQRHGVKIYFVMLSNTYVIPGLHKNPFIVIQALQKGFQVTSEVDTLILKKKSTKICFDDKMWNNGGRGFLLATNFYKSANNTALLDTEKHNP